MDAELDKRLSALLERLDARPHIVPARIELSRENGVWQAMLMADPMYQPVVARTAVQGDGIEQALTRLLEHKIDWRRVRR